MRIFYDNQIFRTQHFGGISRYFSELMTGVDAARDFDLPLRKFYSGNHHLRSNGFTYYNWFKDTRSFRGKIRIENYLLKKEDQHIIKLIEKGRYDIFHPTYYDPVFVNHVPGDKPIVLTVYDMIHELYLKDKAIPAYKKDLIHKAKHIVAISQNTKNDILRLYPEVPEKKIEVIYLGSSLVVPAIELKKELPAKYILFVGNRWTYKNFGWFVKSIARFLIKEKLILLCAGAGPFSGEEQSLLAELDLLDRVEHVHLNTDNDLVALYKNAACFVFPSLYEGFGIPVLEAFSCRCPVVLADASCFPEVAGDAALYFDKDNPESLVRQLSRVIGDPDLAEHLREAGFNRNKLYSWTKTVQQHLTMYSTLGTG